MRHRPATGRLIVAVAMMAALLTTIPQPAGADPGGPASPDAPLPKTVTLVTGDRVTVTEGSGGPLSISTEPAPRPDGARPDFLTQSGPDGTYVIPRDAASAVEAGTLDRELFNVTYLAGNGYADDQTAKIPVIARNAPGVRTAFAGAPARELRSIGAAALEIPKAQAGAFWTNLRGSAVRGSGSATQKPGSGSAEQDPGSGAQEPGSAVQTPQEGTKLWLDRKIEAGLEQSVPLIGAPQAWAAGHDGQGVKVAVLDTGIDAGHPDLTGKVDGSQSFVPGQEVRDGHGHGTHVASTIAGTGAKNRGVAPGARLLVGKVLGNTGNGQSSWAIEGMQWAVDNGAKVVSMSLSSGPSDGTDPMSQAVNRLTASTGTLFVIAAGNVGGPAARIGAPGSADAALTVAATDKSDRLAGFSSRGPRFGDFALKPDISGPGVGIVAARAAGTSMGDPVDELYTSADGTSMATPHVAGSAAILAQHHPDWKADRLKAALMSTAKDAGRTAYEQGAGRVDVARADAQQVIATTTGLDYGLIFTGKDPAPIAKQITYANLSDRPVTLTLTPALRSGGGPVEGKLTVGDTLVVPAGGTATTTVTLDVAGLGASTYSGAVIATADGVSVTTPAALVRETPKVKLTVRTLGRDGEPIDPFGYDVVNVDGSGKRITGGALAGDGVVVYRVPEGTYSVTEFVGWVDEDSRDNRAWLSDPEVVVTGDTEITLDARKATRARFSTPRESEPLSNSFVASYQRTTESGERFTADVELSSWTKFWAAPTERVAKGAFRFSTHWMLGRSEVALSVLRPDRRELHAAAPHNSVGMQSYHPGFVPFEGTHDLPLVPVGKGLPADLAGVDVRGKLALMEADGAAGTCGMWIERVADVRQAGAAGLIVYPPAGSRCAVPLNIWQKPFTGPPKEVGIRNVHISTAEAQSLLAEKGVTLRVSGTPRTEHTYALNPYEEGRIPASLHYRYTGRDLAQLDLSFHSGKAPAEVVNQLAVGKHDSRTAGMSSIYQPHIGQTLREYVGPLSAEVAYRRTAGGAGLRDVRSGLAVFDRAAHDRQQWSMPGATPGGATASDAVFKVLAAAPDPARGAVGLPCVLCRQGDKLVLWLTMVTGGPDTQQIRSIASRDYEVHLYKEDGTELPLETMDGLLPHYTLPQERAAYRLTAKAWQSESAWTFTSAAPQADEERAGVSCYLRDGRGFPVLCRPEALVYVSYDFGAAVSTGNSVRAPGMHTFRVHAYHSPSRTPMPRVAGLKLWVSTDDGARWTRVPAVPDPRGGYLATAFYPDPKGTSGAVSLKVEAWDAAGNRVEQVTKRAFTLS